MKKFRVPVGIALAAALLCTAGQDGERARWRGTGAVLPGRNKTHLGPRGLAPYFWDPAALFATSATSMLLSEKGNDVTTTAQLGKVRTALTKEILSTVGSDGLFTPWGSGTYPSSPAYVNPILGLALIPLVDSCPDGPVPQRSLGILSEGYVAQLRQRAAARGTAPRGLAGGSH